MYAFLFDVTLQSDHPDFLQARNAAITIYVASDDVHKASQTAVQTAKEKRMEIIKSEGAEITAEQCATQEQKALFEEAQRVGVASLTFINNVDGRRN
jgi:phage terminase Nu1 subunit (DNA packaging protein)